MWPLWFKLLEQRNREKGFALTLPFLIGATRLAAGSAVSEAATIRDLSELLRSMRDEAPESDYVRISECDRLLQPVVNKMANIGHPGVGFVPVPSPVHGRQSLFVQVKYLADGAQCTARAAETFWRTLGSAISSSRFTFENGKYLTLSEEDIAFVRRAAAISEDEWS